MNSEADGLARQKNRNRLSISPELARNWNHSTLPIQASGDRLAETLWGQPFDMLMNNAGTQALMWMLDEVEISQFEGAPAVNAVRPV